MSNVINHSLAELRKRSRELDQELRRVNKAIEALSNISEAKSVKHVREKKLTIKCQRPGCSNTFIASRSDAKFCSTNCTPSAQARIKSRGVVLVKGAER